MRKNTVIFDLDGTLLNTIDDLADGVNYILEKYRYPLYKTEQIQAFVGNGVVNLMERSLPEGKNNPIFETALKEFKEYYATISENKTRPYEGITSMLHSLKDQQIKMAVVSNKFHPAVVKLTDKYFGRYIHVAVGEDAGRRKKPAPDSVFAVLKQLDSTVNEAVYVGDSEVDIQTAQNAGVDLIAVSWGFRGKEELTRQGASTIIDHPAELLSLLL